MVEPKKGIQIFCMIVATMMIFTIFVSTGVNASGATASADNTSVDLINNNVPARLSNDTRPIDTNITVNITYPQPSTYDASVRLANDTRPSTKTGTVLGPQPLTGTDILSGRVTNQGGTPLSNAYIVITSASLSAWTDSNGYYSISYPDGQFWGNYPAQVSHTGYLNVNQLIWLGSPTNTWNIVMSSGCTLHGRVTNQGGSPLSNAYITLPSAYLAAWSDYNGYYWISYASGAYWNNYPAQVSHPAYLNVNQLIWLGSSDNTWNIVMSAGCTVHGRVTDSMTGNPISSASISFQGTSLSATSDFNGYYSISYTSISPQGNYNGIVTHSGYNTVNTLVWLGSSDNTWNIQMVNNVPVQIHGYAYDNTSGLAINGATIYCSGVSGQYVTGVNGYFTFSVLVGPHTLTASQGYYNVIIDHITVTGPSTYRYDIPMSRSSYYPLGPNLPSSVTTLTNPVIVVRPGNGCIEADYASANIATGYCTGYVYASIDNSVGQAKCYEDVGFMNYAFTSTGDQFTVFNSWNAILAYAAYWHSGTGSGTSYDQNGWSINWQVIDHNANNSVIASGNDGGGVVLPDDNSYGPIWHPYVMNYSYTSSPISVVSSHSLEFDCWFELSAYCYVISSDGGSGYAGGGIDAHNGNNGANCMMLTGMGIKWV